MFPFSKNCPPTRHSAALIWSWHRGGEVLRACILLAISSTADGRYPEAVTALQSPCSGEAALPRRKAKGGGRAPKSGQVRAALTPGAGCGVQGRAAQIWALLTPPILLSSSLPPKSFPIPAPQTLLTSPHGPKLSCFSLRPRKPPLPSLVHP